MLVSDPLQTPSRPPLRLADGLGWAGLINQIRAALLALVGYTRQLAEEPVKHSPVWNSIAKLFAVLRGGNQTGG